MFDELYDRSRRRVTALAADLTPEQRTTVVPATPLWTAQQLVAHLTGAASDAVHGVTAGMPGPEWTAVHVAARDGHPLELVLAEWDALAPRVGAALADRTMNPMIVHDVLTHEADLREAFDLGRPPADDLDAALHHLARGVVRRMAAPLSLRAGDRSWGEGPDTVTASPYELYRGLISRRSRAQMRAWDWTGDPTPHIEALPAFGPCTLDQPVPR